MKYQALTTQHVREKGFVVIDVEVWYNTDAERNLATAALLAEITEMVNSHETRSFNSSFGYGYSIPKIENEKRETQ